jgi:hypothetical protein
MARTGRATSSPPSTPATIPAAGWALPVVVVEMRKTWLVPCTWCQCQHSGCQVCPARRGSSVFLNTDLISSCMGECVFEHVLLSQLKFVGPGRARVFEHTAACLLSLVLLREALALCCRLSLAPLCPLAADSSPRISLLVLLRLIRYQQPERREVVTKWRVNNRDGAAA